MAPPPPVGYRPPPPRPVPPPPFGGYYPGAALATGIAVGAMLTVLPATAIAITEPSTGVVIYQDNNQCYMESYQDGAKVYVPTACP